MKISKICVSSDEKEVYTSCIPRAIPPDSGIQKHLASKTSSIPDAELSYNFPLNFLQLLRQISVSHSVCPVCHSVQTQIQQFEPI